jgi:hypothetical protein
MAKPSNAWQSSQINADILAKFPLPKMIKKIARFANAASAIVALCTIQIARADDGTAFIMQHISDVLKIEAAPDTDPAVVATFGNSIYTVTIGIADGDSLQTNTIIVARSGDGVASLSRPSTDGDYPKILKMLNPSLRLTGDSDLKAVQNAFDIVYPIAGLQDMSVRDYRHVGNQWILVRGMFFDKKMGFVLTTDANGAVIDVKYVLKLP